MSKKFYTLFLLFLFTASPFVIQAGSNNPKVIMKTTMGDMVIELYENKAPLTVKNFLSYVDEKFYDGTIFHRVIRGFMIQGGGFTPDFKEKPAKPPIKNEAFNGLSNKRGTIAMARTEVINSATCQFFINHKDNSNLDHRDNTPTGFGYAVFGKVIKGLNVVDAIAKVKTKTQGWHADVPRETIEIVSIRRMENK
jgi:cyclophilin family peptidyl-prolyl cis-trans isomerase